MTVIPSVPSAPAKIPHILLYATGNHTHPLTKHSLGQYIIPSLLARFGLPGERESMRLERKHDCWVGSGMVRGRGSGGGDQDAGFRLTVAKPRVLMNINGRPLPFLLRTLSASHPPSTYAPPTLIALHDNLTLHPLTVGKPRFGVSSQGHGGLSSIESSLKTKDFWRLGLGIGRGGNAPGDGGVVKWVLSELGRDEKAFWEAEGVDRVAEVVEGIVDKLRRGDARKSKGKK